MLLIEESIKSSYSTRDLFTYTNQLYRLNSSTLTYLPALPSLSTKQVRSCRDYKMSVRCVLLLLWILWCIVNFAV